MRIPVWLVVVAAVFGALLILVVGQIVLQPDLPLITEAAFTPDVITPNADGQDDITTFRYTLTRNANVSLRFEGEDGSVYLFRQDQPRIPDDYQVDFSGVVDGYLLPGEEIQGEVLRRLMPNGTYTWRLVAVDGQSEKTEERSGTLVIADGDLPLPEITAFTVAPDVFTPNQDGISDHTEVNAYLEKAADLSVFLVDDEGQRIFITPRQEGRKPGEAGRHGFDYDGGVSLGADPPSDGTYTVVARAQDAEGQVIQRTASLTIRDGGKPRAEIVPQSVGADVLFMVQPYDEQFHTEAEHPSDLMPLPEGSGDANLTSLTVPLGDMLVFKLTVENYSDIPIRTSGPPPGTVYDQTQRAATLDAFDESGAWRVGVDCTTAESDYPWRWAIGTAEDLVEELDPVSGNTYYYLPAGKRAVIWGGIRMTELEARNPQNCWAGLIHEDVSVVNQNVGNREIELVDPTNGGE
ncbi:MAG: hypothetical protein K8L99_21500 [Anaerolineae bacterium]|nr:hypothetical protein [Anaerolineae bacterium]